METREPAASGLQTCEASSLSEGELSGAKELVDRALEAVSSVVMDSALTQRHLWVALIAGGHVLLEGVPGVAKTTIVRAFSAAIGAQFGRVQFTPDLLPSDIIGAHVPAPGGLSLEFRRGPIFTNLLLGDEINRAPARTQSALLEAMAEAQVTVESETYKLPEPFFVLATQNPIDEHGVYPLPEAQLDRFMILAQVGYPTLEAEVEMLATYRAEVPMPGAIADAAAILELREMARRVYVSDTIMSYIVRLCRASRGRPELLIGASPRAALNLMHAARALALIQGRAFVRVEDVRELAHRVLVHRLVTRELDSPDREISTRVIDRLLADIPWE